MRLEAGERPEDFDELDELLEIALSTLGVGEVTAQTALQKFSESFLEEKMGRKFPASALNGEKTPIPYRKRDQQPQKKNRKFAILGIFGLILLLVALWLAFGTKSPDIDATGNLLLEKSRNLESVDSQEDILRGVP